MNLTNLKATKPRKFFYKGRWLSQRDLRKWYDLTTEEIKKLPSETHENLAHTAKTTYHKRYPR